MKITIHCVGTLKERYWKDACAEYLKRLQPYAKVVVEETADLPIKEGASIKEEEDIKRREGEKVLAKLKPGDYVIALDLGREECDSPRFAEKVKMGLVRGGSSLVFLIGGSLGLSEELKKRADESISFGLMTFPHQLARVMLLEQLYRAFRILHHQPYHK